MSAYTMDQVWAPIQARYAEQVARETWGHLAPHKNKTYRGHVLFAIGCYDCGELNPTVLAAEMGIDDSPWFYDALTEFLGEGQHIETQRFQVGKVYRFEGSFRNYVFRGSFTEMSLSPSAIQKGVTP